MKVISLGWGVQSWTLAAMSALGELEPVDVALHSDTTWERQETYEFAAKWTPWLEERGVKVVTVSEPKQTQKVVNGEPDIPAFTTKASPIIALRNDNFEVVIPGFTSYLDGNPSGMLRRQCTHRWKITPMRQWLAQELKRLNIPKVPVTIGELRIKLEQGYWPIQQWLGITIDEIERAKDSDVQWITHRFPLLEKKMTRQDCITWLQSHGLPVPGKSSCVFCPYHRRATWQEMKRANGPDWATAVEVDGAIRNKRPGYVAYVHPDRIPLIELKIAEDFGATQGNFLDLLNAECDSGYCFL